MTFSYFYNYDFMGIMMKSMLVMMVFMLFYKFRGG